MQMHPHLLYPLELHDYCRALLIPLTVELAELEVLGTFDISTVQTLFIVWVYVACDRGIQKIADLAPIADTLLS